MIQIKLELKMRYPRDMLGYGEMLPKVTWPEDAKLAVQFVVNYEEGGENCILHGDGQSEAFLSEIVGAANWADMRHANMESIYEYGARAGFWRVKRLFDELKIKPTVYGVATALARNPEQTCAMVESGWEMACHGLKWIEYKNFTKEEERADMQEAIKLHTEVTGSRPLGWYTGRSSINTLDLVAEEGGFEYAADAYADDLPYWQNCDGRYQLIVPYTLDTNDMRFATPQGFNSGQQFFTYLKDSFDVLYQEGVEGFPKMLSVGLHCRLVGRPGRVQALRRFMEYAISKGDVWFPTRLEIARHWKKHHPLKTYERPSEMDEKTFINNFGSIFEYSEWVAQRAFKLELGMAHDTANGLHHALVRVFRGASYDERLQVLKAHPDLAGKIAAAGKLTAESTLEQKSAGLGMLSDEERKIFTSLNTEYQEKHGFPFIIAARDNNKTTILEKFKARIASETDIEFEEACKQVERIAQLRLIELLE